GAAPDEPDNEPAPDIAPARPRGADQDGQRGKCRERVVLVLEPREGEDPDDGDQPDHDDRPPPRLRGSIRLSARESEDTPRKGPEEARYEEGRGPARHVVSYIAARV